MDFPILIDAIRIGLSIVFFKGSQVLIFKIMMYLCHRILFLSLISNSAYSDLPCLQKYQFVVTSTKRITGFIQA